MKTRKNPFENLDREDLIEYIEELQKRLKEYEKKKPKRERTKQDWYGSF